MTPDRNIVAGIVLVIVAAALIALMACWGLQPLILVLP